MRVACYGWLLLLLGLLAAAVAGEKERETCKGAAAYEGKRNRGRRKKERKERKKEKKRKKKKREKEKQNSFLIFFIFEVTVKRISF